MDNGAPRSGGRGLLFNKLLPKVETAEEPKLTPLGRGMILRHLNNSASVVPNEIPNTSSVSSSVPNTSAPSVSTPSVSGLFIGRGRARPIETKMDQLCLEPQVIRPSEPEAPRQFRPRFTLENVSKSHHGHANDKSKSMMVASNYVKLFCKTSFVYQHHVFFDPNVASKQIRTKIINSIESGKFDVLPVARIFDGRVLYLPKQITNDQLAFSVKIPNDKNITVQIKFVAKKPVESVPALFNNLFKKMNSFLGYVRVGRNTFLPQDKVNMQQLNLEVWPGYVTTVDRFEDGLLLLCDVSHRVVRTDTVYDLLSSINSRNGDFRGFADAVVGTSVLTRYNNRVYKIDDVAFNMSPVSSFACGEDATSTTFERYYQTQYQIKIKDTTQPLLVSKVRMLRSTNRDSNKKGPGSSESSESSRTLYLIPELCYQTGLTDDMRKDFNLMRSLNTVTKPSPHERQDKLLKFCDTCKANPEARQLMTEWGIEFSSKSLQVPALKLNQEQILFGRGRKTNGDETAEFKRDVGSMPVIQPVEISNWLFICQEREFSKANDFIDALIKRGQIIGIQFSKPTIVKLASETTDGFIKAIESNFSRKLMLVVCLFKQVREDRYMQIKRLLYSEKGIASQMVLSKTIGDARKLMSVATNIALQINAKLGGELWSVSLPIDKLMVVGIDIYHEGTGSTRRSVGGVVGSLNQSCTKYFSQPVFQAPKQEIMHTMYQCMGNLFKKFYDVNHFLPETIFVYRDGVSDNQLVDVQRNEVEDMEAAFNSFAQSFSPGYSPKLVFQVVQKRISTRIFSLNSKDGNPRPGTVVDSTITRSDAYDFFLVPQSVRQGTATPTHYIVLHDKSSLSPEVVQSMAFKCCHLYYNWPGTIRVPAPCQYAHKIAYMAGAVLRKAPKPEILDTLFYL